MAVGQGSRGKIELFSDFAGSELAVTGAVNGPINFFPFVVTGDGIDATDSGIVAQTTLLGGVIRLTSTNADDDWVYIATELMFDVALMSPLILEARVQRSTLSGGRVFVGLTNDTCDADVGTPMEANTGTVTNTMTNFVGFLWDSGATLSTTWLYGYNGGATTAALTTEQTTGKLIVAGEWDVLRVEVFNDGTVRWYINGEYITEKEGCISTTTDIGVLVGNGSTTTATSHCDLDYVYVSASRDWTK